MKIEYPNSYLLTSRLNQDLIENLFGNLRARGAFNDSPTAMQIRPNLQYAILTNSEKSSNNTNCESDGTFSLFAVNDGIHEKCDNCSESENPFGCMHLNNTETLSVNKIPNINYSI